MINPQQLQRKLAQTKPMDYEPEFDPTALRFSKSKGPQRRGTDLLVVTTYCQKDNWLMMKRAEWMKHLGVKPTHDLLLIGDSDVTEPDLQSMGALYRDCFRTVFTAKLKGQGMGEGWPRGTNSAFRNSVRLMHGMFKLKFDNMQYRGFFYFESDITPLNPNFLPLMHSLYLEAKLPFMGVVGEIKTKEGVVIRHMNGAGIYPFGDRYFTPEIMLTDNAPWDVAGLTGPNFLRLVHDLNHTRYSMHFSTSEYKKIGEAKYSATKTPHGAAPFQVTCDIFPTHLIHHGCKDASLMDDLMGKKFVTVDLPPRNPGENYIESFKLNPPKFKKKRGAKKSPKAKKEKHEPSSPEVIRAAYKKGMKWKDLIKTHHVMPVALKKILKG